MSPPATRQSTDVVGGPYRMTRQAGGAVWRVVPLNSGRVYIFLVHAVPLLTGGGAVSPALCFPEPIELPVGRGMPTNSKR